MTVEHLPGYLMRHWPKIKAALLTGSYKPLPVRRKEIAKPDGGVRLLGIPTVLDRLIQQAIAQVLQAIWDHTFSEFSYGFRPGRSQHTAILQAKRYIAEGHKFVVDLDLEKFFDKVNHDRLLSRLSTRVNDPRVLRLIGRVLRSGVMIGGLCEPTEEGTPQGGPLSPLLSNIVLDELDKELEKRGLHFVRYADDSVIYVKSKRAGDRVMQSVSRFVSRELKLKVNEAKSSVNQPGYTKYLGFGFTIGTKAPRIRIHSKSLQRFRERVRAITARSRGRSIGQVIRELNEYSRGWWGYFSLCEARSGLRLLNAWIVRRLRAYLWKQWKHPRTKVRELLARGIPDYWAHVVGATRKGPWRLSANTTVAKALPVSYFTGALGLVLPG
jgi:RNA-directed DNA polymerase